MPAPPLPLLAAVLLAGCGGQTAAAGHATARTVSVPRPSPSPSRSRSRSRSPTPTPPPSPCTPAVVAAARRALGGPVRSRPDTANDGSPECIARSRAVSVIAEVNVTPSAYFLLERAIVEDGQQFSTQREVPSPVHVGGVGKDASWFGDQQHLLTSDGKRLITVGVSGRGLSRSRKIAIAREIALAILGRAR